MKRMRKMEIFFGIFLCCGALFLQGAGRSQGGELRLQKAPPFSLSSPKGEKIELKDFSGKVVYLDFWGAWCPPCIEETPHLVSLYNTYKEKGFVVIGISLGDSEKSLLRFMEKMQILYPVVLGDDKIIQAYQGVVFLPTAFLIDRKGFIRRKLFGYREKEEIEQLILPLLEEK